MEDLLAIANSSFNTINALGSLKGSFYTLWQPALRLNLQTEATNVVGIRFKNYG